MADALAIHGFEIRRCAGREATREGILEAYERLIRASGEGDAAVVYYSGHGGIALAPVGGRSPARRHRFLVPVDLDHSTDDDFRGVLDEELSALQARLTARTRNVTVILDCCHAARLSRDPGLRFRALARSWTTGVAAHLERLRRLGRPEATVDVESNPHALRLVATGPNLPAYEHTGADGRTVGIFTEGLYWLLVEAGGRAVPWDPLLRRLREHVLSRAHDQRCEIEGPRERLLFRAEATSRTGVLSFFLDGDRPSLDGGRVLGVAPGDVYAVLPLEATAADPRRRLATATVTAVETAVSRVALDPPGAGAEIPTGAPAFPLARVPRRRPVAVTAAGEARSRLVAVLAGSPYLQPVEEGTAGGLLARVVAAGGRLELRDAAGDPLLAPAPFGAKSLAALLANLETLARAAFLRALDGGAGEAALATPFAVELGRVGPGGAEPLPPSGASLSTGEAVYLTIRNRGSEPIYVSAFDVGVDGAVTLLTTSEPSGVELFAGGEYRFGEREPVGLVGVRLSWPPALPAVVPRRESLVVIAADRPLDLRAFESLGLQSLEPAAATVDGARTAVEARAHRYAVRHLDFELRPPAA